MVLELWLASIDLDGEPKRSYLYAALDLQKLWVLVKNSGPMATCALSARRSYNFRIVFGFPSISFTKQKSTEVVDCLRMISDLALPVPFDVVVFLEVGVLRGTTGLATDLATDVVGLCISEVVDVGVVGSAPSSL